MKSITSNTIQEIIDLFENLEGFSYWKIKTDVVGIVENFCFKLQLISKDKREKYIQVNKIFNQNKFYLRNGSFDVTPTKKLQTSGYSKSAIRQYIDVLLSFDIITKVKDIKEVYEIKYSELLDNNFDYNNIIDSLFKNLITKLNILNTQAKKLFYSILLSNIIYLSNDDDNQFKIKIKKNNFWYPNKNEISKYSKSCGYIRFKDYIVILGNDFYTIYKSLQKIL
ncbi:hypothetical protein SCORR_v1c06770 [Spiroplasma corruscae]|uniref:Uncharacterized protein n=1 Tax=Spiroplasma corruscae TaxID=216934 RepID=A0A222EPI7_9MOLU|nr:hypothetical protein [Spiroplasma corruscae]ASP28449.1 hypothetical protein SCORR_v1c06770 [Spiroplasma corruscae]